MRRLIVLASLSAMLLATFGIAIPVRAAFPGAEGLIAYTDYSLAPNGVIATFDPVTKERVGLTTAAQSPHGDYEPSWSPGGTLIVFTRLSASSADVWIMNADGSGQKRLTTHSAWDDNPAFSADGSRVLFSTERHGQFDIYSMNLTGGSLKRLTTSTGDDFMAVWSPDNDRIAFVSSRRGNPELWLMRPDGSNQLALTDHRTGYQYDYAPDWHPDGDQLTASMNSTLNAFPRIGIILEKDVGFGLSQIYETDQIHTLGYSAFSPQVDVDGWGRVIFHEQQFGNYDLHVINILGREVTRVTEYETGAEVYPDWQPIPDFPLVDARFSTFKAHIEWAYAEGITGGCTAERFCPEGNVTRAQMAMFLDRALDLPSTTKDFFSDDNGKTGEASINRLAASGITGGCAPGKFCPSASVTRGQMAAFLARAFDLPGTSTDYFTDDENSTFESSINKVAAAGITGGCGGTKYCPLANVTRGQMAAFLRRALD
jgi:Tol biopolymer transport system component